MPEEYTEDNSAESPESEDEFVARCRRQFQQDEDDEQPIREQALLDLRFVAGDQWDNSVKNDRITNGRPALTFNRCHTFVQQVANEARQMRGEIKFSPELDQDKDTAEIYEGMARHIQYNSRAKIAYETAVDYSAGGSFGYYRFLPDYCDDDSWDQEIKVVSVPDPFAVYGILIPSCFGLKPDHAFVVEEVPRDEYQRLYGTEDIDAVGWEQAAKLSDGWIGTETVRVAEYWYVEHDTKEVKRKRPGTGEEEVRIIDKVRVCFCKLNGYRVIPGTKTTWLGERIPIFPVLGKTMILDGKPVIASLVRYQRDPQQLLNFYKTRIAETLGTQPIQPYMVPEGAISKENLASWKKLNTSLLPFLSYKPYDETGRPVQPPQRQVLEPPIVALSNAAGQEVDDMKASAGIFDASLGNSGNEISGRGIMARQQQSNTTNMHFIDNLERSFDESGTELACAIPRYYDGARMVRILGPDEAPKVVKINQPYTDSSGQPKHYKVGGDGAGKYHVIVSMGRAFSSKRMESFDMMSQLVQGNPQLLPMIGDILFANSDVAGSQQLSERFKKMLPPQLQSDDGSPEAKLNMAMAKMQQMGQQTQQLGMALQNAQRVIDAKQIEAQSRERIEQFKAQKEFELKVMTLTTQRDIAEIQTKAQDVRERAKLDAALDVEQHVAAHELGLQKDQQAHAMQLAQQQAQQQQLQQTSEANQGQPSNGQA